MRVAVVGTVVGIFLVVAPHTAAGVPGTELREFGESARAYMASIDAGDLERQMAFWSEDPAATSAIMGEVWTGRASIRGRSADYVPVSKLIQNELSETRVLPLGPDGGLRHALPPRCAALPPTRGSRPSRRATESPAERYYWTRT